MIHIMPRYRSLRVLCVEEDVVQRKLLEACLDVADIESFFVEGPDPALAIFRRYPLDMIFLDFDQHTQDELAAFRVMRDTGQRGKQVPVMAITSNDCRWTHSAYREAGFAALCEKPIEPGKLFETMDDVLREAGQPPLLENRYMPQLA